MLAYGRIRCAQFLLAAMEQGANMREVRELCEYVVGHSGNFPPQTPDFTSPPSDSAVEGADVTPEESTTLGTDNEETTTTDA